MPLDKCLCSAQYGPRPQAPQKHYPTCSPQPPRGRDPTTEEQWHAAQCSAASPQGANKGPGCVALLIPVLHAPPLWLASSCQRDRVGGRTENSPGAAQHLWCCQQADTADRNTDGVKCSKTVRKGCVPMMAYLCFFNKMYLVLRACS